MGEAVSHHRVGRNAGDVLVERRNLRGVEFRVLRAGGGEDAPKAVGPDFNKIIAGRCFPAGDQIFRYLLDGGPRLYWDFEATVDDHARLGGSASRRED